MVTKWQRQVARVYGVPLRFLLGLRSLRPMHVAYSRRLRARRRAHRR